VELQDKKEGNILCPTTMPHISSFGTVPCITTENPRSTLLHVSIKSIPDWILDSLPWQIWRLEDQQPEEAEHGVWVFPAPDVN
jgi:hypothetical protein